MKIAAAFIAALVVSSTLQAQTPVAGRVDDERAVRTRVETAMLATVRADTATLRDVYASDYRMGDRNGGTINRYARIRQLTLSKTRGNALTPAYVRVMGNVAVAGGRVPNSRDEWMQIWDRQAGQWKLSYEEYARPKGRTRR